MTQKPQYFTQEQAEQIGHDIEEKYPFLHATTTEVRELKQDGTHGEPTGNWVLGVYFNESTIGGHCLTLDEWLEKYGPHLTASEE